MYGKSIDNSDDIKETVQKLKDQKLIGQVSKKNLILLLKDFNFSPNKSNNIFPSKTLENSTAMYYQKCDSIYKKFININMIVSICNFDREVLVSLTIDLARKDPNDLKAEIDHYFSLELLISFAFNWHKTKKDSNLEYLIGKFMGLYAKALYFDYILIAHIIDQITVLFPSFYLPKNDFSTEKDQKDYFDKMVSFFHGILSEFNPTTSAKILKKILTPIKTPIKDLSDIELVYIKLIEENFFNSLFNCLEYSNFNRGTFILEYDTMGFFRDVLRKNDKLFKYGFDYDTNYDIIENSGNISHFFKLHVQDRNVSETLLRLVN